MKINFPTNYEVDYPIKNKYYYGETFKKDITVVLLKASDNYCMYCGRKLVLDNEYYFNLEHSIEKDGYPGIEKPKTPFKHCKYNLSVACIRCNQKYKNKMIERIPYNLVSKDLNCMSKSCNEPCTEYLIARDTYLKMNKIILQPDGVKSSKNVLFNIQYDLLKQIYVPNIENTSSADIDFIEEHIARFNLNRDTASTCIMEVCELLWKIIDLMPDSFNIRDVLNISREVHFDNIIGKVFIEYIQENIKDMVMLKEFCELYMLLSYV
ncbi:MAG: hypothetical protein F8N38_06290 [Hungatella sp.]|nr:hypothetical protein [Hungatella sp.]